jgi:hypothetical protein
MREAFANLTEEDQLKLSRLEVIAWCLLVLSVGIAGLVLNLKIAP